MKVAIFFALVLAASAMNVDDPRGGWRCRSDGECGPNHCCLGPTCSPYLQEGTLCKLGSFFGCGCQPGLDCVNEGFLNNRCRGPGPGCGRPQVQFSEFVVGGDDAKRGAWPWQVLMFQNGRAGCGGSLISSRWVVTAAHCVDGSENYPSSFKVRVGEHDRTRQEGSEVDMQVERVFKHEKYSGYPYTYDIALFKLSKPVVFNKYVQPVCLPSGDVRAGHQCYITGWGKIRHPGPMHSYLQQAKMNVVTNQVCEAKNYPSLGIHVTDDMICGGDAGRTNIDACHGDSGGPYVCLVNGRWELHGAVSWGSPRCVARDAYSVFARVTYFKKWIQDKMTKFGQ